MTGRPDVRKNRWDKIFIVRFRVKTFLRTSSFHGIDRDVLVAAAAEGYAVLYLA